MFESGTTYTTRSGPGKYRILVPIWAVAYELNNDLLLLSLYSLMPPLRNEIEHLNFTVQRKRDGDYIWLDTDVSNITIYTVVRRT